MRINLLLNPNDRHDRTALGEAEEWVERYACLGMCMSQGRDEDDARTFIAQDGAQRHGGSVA